MEAVGVKEGVVEGVEGVVEGVEEVVEGVVVVVSSGRVSVRIKDMRSTDRSVDICILSPVYSSGICSVDSSSP
jgi:hypothetical protein